jgi:CO/xanthine dehydrogenase Mo-binding subunit
MRPRSFQGGSADDVIGPGFPGRKAHRSSWRPQVEASDTPLILRKCDWLVGMGCATGTYPYYRMRGGAARLTITREGRAAVAITAHELGLGTATAHAQVAAKRLGLASSRCRGSAATPIPGRRIAGASQQTASIGASIIAAHPALGKELLKRAGNDSRLAGLGPDEVAVRWWALRSRRRVPSRRLRLATDVDASTTRFRRRRLSTVLRPKGEYRHDAFPCRSTLRRKRRASGRAALPFLNIDARSDSRLQKCERRRRSGVRSPGRSDIGSHP